jgi:DNA-binding IclR family transcriptional regulator
VTFAALVGRVLRTIRRNPGSRAVEIAERLGEPTRDVRRALYKLKREQRIRRTGNTRGAVYRPAAAKT